jgi:hypothetical protein
LVLRFNEHAPRPYLDGVVRWRLIDLAQWLWEEFGSHSVVKQLAGNSAAWVFASSQPAPAIMRRMLKLLKHLKKLPRCAGNDPEQAYAWNRDRNLVPGRSQDRAEEQNHP